MDGWHTKASLGLGAEELDPAGSAGHAGKPLSKRLKLGNSQGQGLI